MVSEFGTSKGEHLLKVGAYSRVGTSFFIIFRK